MGWATRNNDLSYQITWKLIETCRGVWLSLEQNWPLESRFRARGSFNQSIRHPKKIVRSDENVLVFSEKDRFVNQHPNFVKIYSDWIRNISEVSQKWNPQAIPQFFSDTSIDQEQRRTNQTSRQSPTFSPTTTKSCSWSSNSYQSVLFGVSKCNRSPIIGRVVCRSKLVVQMDP